MPTKHSQFQVYWYMILDKLKINQRSYMYHKQPGTVF